MILIVLLITCNITVLAQDGVSHSSIGFERLRQLYQIYNIDNNPEFVSKLEGLEADLSKLSSKLDEFAQCLDTITLSSTHFKLSREDRLIDFSCSKIGKGVNNQINKIQLSELKSHELACQAFRKRATKFAVVNKYISTSIISNLIFLKLFPYISHIEHDYIKSLVKPLSSQELRDLVKRSITDTVEIKEAMDWYQMRRSFKRKERHFVKEIILENKNDFQTITEKFSESIEQINESNIDLKDKEELIASLNVIQTAVKNSRKNQAFRTKIANTLTIVGNLTWGLPNTVVGGIVALMSMVAHPFIPADEREAMDFGISSNGKQIRFNSQLIYGNGISFESSLGMFQTTNSGGDNNEHEGGHAVQSAILGPFYFPAVGLSYLISGFDAGVMEEWADRAGKKTDTNKPETLFSCPKE